uniref:Transcriptional regulator n=1 Tax=Mesocestoides corti TaxID=53468 RepID=A0A5K3ET99_MESCO
MRRIIKGLIIERNLIEQRDNAEPATCDQAVSWCAVDQRGSALPPRCCARGSHLPPIWPKAVANTLTLSAIACVT